MAQFHGGIGSMIGKNTHYEGSKSKEVEHLLLRWLGEDSMFSQPLDTFRESITEELKAPAFQKDTDLATHVSALAWKLTPLLAQMRSHRSLFCVMSISTNCTLLPCAQSLFVFFAIQSVSMEARLEFIRRGRAHCLSRASGVQT